MNENVASNSFSNEDMTRYLEAFDLFGGVLVNNTGENDKPYGLWRVRVWP